jgi:hypothetical protein
MRESIVEALHWMGPLSAPDLKGVIDDPGSPLARVAYHLTVLASGGVLTKVGARPAGASPETIYYFPVR